MSLSGRENCLDALGGAGDVDSELARIDITGIHRAVRNEVLPKYPRSLQRALKREYLATAGPTRTRAPDAKPGDYDSWARANRQLFERDCQLAGGRFFLASNPEEIKLKAARCTRIARGLISKQPTAIVAYDAACNFATHQGVTPPAPTSVTQTLQGCLTRLADDRWWGRKLKRTLYRTSEQSERDFGLVQATTGLYASDDAVERREQDRARSRALLAETYAINECGQTLTLADIAETTISNPAIRRSELMVRLRGFEEYATKHNHVGEFFTLTLPSRFHAYRRHGDANPNFDGSSPAEGQHWLNTTWARIRAQLDRAGIRLYGFRVAEPHHDGTPHWHLLLFFDTTHRDTIHEVFDRYMLEEAPEEPGARQHRWSTVAIDPARGSATGYFAKYISKNIDGEGVGRDLEDDRERDASATCVRFETWASVWNIRQFQQIGGPPVGVWRELRRLRQPIGGRIEPARQAADNGDWCAFIEAMGGIHVPFRSCSIRILKFWSDLPGAYGDPIGYQVAGLECDEQTVSTRFTEWTILWGNGSAVSRTRVNNCTHVAPVVWPRGQTWRSIEPP